MTRADLVQQALDLLELRGSERKRLEPVVEAELERLLAARKDREHWAGDEVRRVVAEAATRAWAGYSGR
jgi:hypothetical protein